jgi:hypothetical protein
VYGPGKPVDAGALASAAHAGPQRARSFQTVPRRPLANTLSASTTDFPASSAPVGRVHGQARSLAGHRFSARNFYIGLTVVALAIGAASLLVPSTPSYDPWSWIVWGREIIHLNLKITTGGTSWKPLPMIFTIPFALFGKAAPNLWLVIARAGAFAAVVMTFRLAYRLTRQLAVSFRDRAEAEGGLATIAPALLAGLIAAVALAFSASGGYISANTLGYSEGFATALMLIAIERHLDDKPRQAFVVGFFVALDRPEIWLFWGPYGLWLFWKDAGARALIIGCFVLIPILWFLPVYWGSGHFGSSVTRAVHPRANSLAFAKFPFEAELKQAAWPTMLLRVKVLAALLVLVTAVVLWRARRREGNAALRTPRARALLGAAAMGIGGLAWFLVIAVMTQVGFSGNNRYLVLGAALVDICGAVAFGWLALELGHGAAAWRRRRRAGSSTAEAGTGSGTLVTAATVLVVAFFVLVPNWVGGGLVSLPRTHGSLVYQAHLRQGLAKLVDRYGGAGKVLACGTVMTEGFQVPMVAWTLDVHTVRVEGPPAAGTTPGAPPNVILQTRDTRSATLLPYLSSWPTVKYHYVGTEGPVHMFVHCASAT